VAKSANTAAATASGESSGMADSSPSTTTLRHSSTPSHSYATRFTADEPSGYAVFGPQ
jgi:hypothetical protein